MRLPHPPTGATRFFARVLAAVLECPRCGFVMRFTEARSGGVWDKRTSELHCPACRKRFVVGLIAWPIRIGRPGAAPGDAGYATIPKDQVPHERQLAQMRARAGGWWMPEDLRRKRRREPDTNLTAACTCKEGTENTSAQDPNCPIHGGD